MRRLDCFTLGFFLLTVRAEKEDSQGYHAEQTKGTIVTKDLLLKKENTIGQGTAATPTERTRQHTAVTVTAKFPGAVLFDTRPTGPYETRQTTKTSTLMRDNLSTLRIRTESEIPLVFHSNNSTQAGSESMRNGASEPKVHLSTDAVKASLWLHTLLDDKNQRNTDSVALTSADGGPRAPLLSASPPRVIDNLAALRHDKRSQGEDENRVLNLGRNEYPFGTIQSIFQSYTAEGSVRGKTETNLCLTCLKDGRAVSTEKSVTLPALSPDGSSDSLSTEKLALNFTQFTTSILSLDQSIGKEILNKDISKHPSFSVREQLVHNLTFPPLFFNKTVNQSQNILNNSQITSFLSDTGSVAFDTRSLAEMSSATKKDSQKQERQTFPGKTEERRTLTTRALYHSSVSLPTVRKQVKNEEVFGNNVSIGDRESELISLSKNSKSASRSFSSNSENEFAQNQPLNISSASVSITPVITEVAYSSQESALPGGADHSGASHPTARMRLIEAPSAKTSFSLSGPTTSAVKHPESHSLTARADSLISVLRSQTPPKPNPQTTEPILTFLQKDSVIKFASVTTKRDLMHAQVSHTFNSLKHIVKQPFVDPSGSASKLVMKIPQTPPFTTRKVAVPVKLFLTESRRDVDDDVSTLTLTTLSSNSFSEGLTKSGVLGSQSKITQERSFDVSDINHVTSFAKYISDLVNNLKPGAKNQQVLTAVAENEEGEQSEEIKETKLKLEEEEESRDDESLGSKREEIFRSDKKESGKQEKVINGREIFQNTDREKDKMEEHEARTSTEEGGGTIREEDATLRQNKDSRQGGSRDEEGLGEEQSRSLTKEGAEAKREETVSKEGVKHSREIGREDMTNVPPGLPTNSEELNRDKGHTVTNPSSSHSLIKQLGATEHKRVHLCENIVQVVEMKNKPFSNKVTSNHRPLHPTMRSQSPQISMTSFPTEPHTLIKPHPSARTTILTKHEAPSSLSIQNKVAEVTISVTARQKKDPKLSQTFRVNTLKFSDAFKPTMSPHNSATKSAHSELNSISNILSLTTPRLAITAGFLQAQPHFTVNSSTLSASIIYSISAHRRKFSTSVSKANSLMRTTNQREKEEHIIPAHILKPSDRDPLTSNMTKEVNISAVVNPDDNSNDSSIRPPTTATLSSEAHISIGQLTPHQGQSAPQKSQSFFSSSDMTSGQPRSFKLSEQTAHSDALHAPVDDNKQRSVQTLMASMSPEAKNNQFPFSSMSPLLNLVPIRDSFPGTYSLTGLTRSASEKNILRPYSGTEYANGARGRAESLFRTADESNDDNAAAENDSLQMTVTVEAKHSNGVTKQMTENRDEKNSFLFATHTTGKSKHFPSNTDKIKSKIQTEKVTVENTNENNHNKLFNVDGNEEANNIVKTTLENNRLSQLESYNETSTDSIMFPILTTHKIEQAINEDFVPTAKDFVIPDTNDQTGTTAFVESDGLAKIPQIQANDVTNNAIPDMEHHEEKTTEKQNDPSTPRGTVGDKTLPAAHMNSRSDLKASNISTQHIADRIMNVTSDFQGATTKNDIVSLAPTTSTRSLIVFTKGHESALTTSESVQVVIEKSSQATQAEFVLHSNIEFLSLRESPPTRTTSKLPPAVKRKITTETQNVEEPEHEISVQAIKQSQHATSGMIAITRPIYDPGEGIQRGSLNAAHRAGGGHDTTPNVMVEYSSLEDIKTTLTTKNAFEAKRPLHERTPTVRTLDRADQHKKHALFEKTSVSQVILGAVADSVPPTTALPIEFIIKTSCATIGCAKSGETTETTTGAAEIDHTTQEKMYKTQAGNMGKVHINAAHTSDTKPANGNCSTDCLPEKATPQAINLDYAVLSPATSNPYHDGTTVEETATKRTKSMTYETSAKTLRVLIETDHLERRGTLETAQFVKKTAQRQSQRGTFEAQEAIKTGVTLSEPEATTAQTVKTTERTLHTERNNKTQLNRGAAKAEIFEAQNATRSARAVSGGEAVLQESGHRLKLSETEESASELPRLKHRRRTSPHLYLSGVTEVSDDLCGSGNYTAEMSLNLGRGVEPGDAVPAMGNLRVVINLKTNNSRINLGVTSCCLSPTIQPDLTNSTCCLFSRLAAVPAGITLLPSALSTSASFTISLFQMINYSVVYLHCDLSVCLRNRSDCERCLQQRSAFSSEGPNVVVSNLRNRISFGPMLKEVRNSTFSEETDPAELDLVLVIISLVVGSSLVTVMLLLVWLAYRRRAIWPLHSASPPRACCGCLRPGGDLILP